MQVQIHSEWCINLRHPDVQSVSPCPGSGKYVTVVANFSLSFTNLQLISVIVIWAKTNRNFFTES